jgi:hypothetical protein
VEKYPNPPPAKGESIFEMTKNLKNNSKLLISVIIILVNDCIKEIGGNSHAEI